MKEIEKIIDTIIESKKSNQFKAIDIYKIVSYVMDKYSESGLQDAQSTYSSQLVKSINEYVDKIKLVEQFIQDNKSLDHKHKAIMTEYEKVKKRKDELENTSEKEKFLRANDVNEIEEKLNQKNQSISSIILLYNKKIKALNSFIEKEKDLVDSELKSNLITAKSNLEELNTKTVANLNTLGVEPINIQFEQDKLNYHKTIDDYNIRVRKLKDLHEDLEEIEGKHSQVMETYISHNLENTKIFGELKKREGVLAYVESIQSEIDEKLTIYDKKIKEIVDKREELPMYKLAELKKYNDEK